MLEGVLPADRHASRLAVALELGLPGAPEPVLERLPRLVLERAKPFRLTALDPALTAAPGGSGRYGWT